MGKLFQTTGIQVPQKLEEALTEAFATTQDGESSYWALKELKEFRLVTKEQWQEWNKLVRSSFKEQKGSEDQESMKLLTMGETIEVLRAVKKGNKNWGREVESWGPRLRQGVIEAARKDLDLILQHAKPTYRRCH
jgi:NTP pyrophosphatase (non-canonical NTP hydrolase)